MRQRFALELEIARHLVEAGLAHASAKGWPVCIAVVDDAGYPIALARADEASPAAVDGAIGKARTSALTGVDTALLEKMAQSRLTVLSIPRICVEGGVALLYRGQRVGGIGVSGRPPEQDNEVAQAALAAFPRET